MKGMWLPLCLFLAGTLSLVASANNQFFSAVNVVAVAGVPKPEGAVGYYFNENGQVQWIFNSARTGGTASELAVKRVCSSCARGNQFCGLYNFSIQRWDNGSWFQCQLPPGTVQPIENDPNNHNEDQDPHVWYGPDEKGCYYYYAAPNHAYPEPHKRIWCQNPSKLADKIEGPTGNDL